MTETNWDTDETATIIMNDEFMYEMAVRMERGASSTTRLESMLIAEFEEMIRDYPYSDINMTEIDWYEIAVLFQEPDE